MQQCIKIEKKIMRLGTMLKAIFRALLGQRVMYTFCKIFSDKVLGKVGVI